MQLKFSLKWLLVAVAYIALAVAACRFRTTILSDLLFLMSSAIWLSAVLALFLSSGRARAVALGFVVWSAAYVAMLWLKPGLAPSGHLAGQMGATHITEQRMKETEAMIQSLRGTLDDPGQSPSFRSLQEDLAARIAESNLIRSLNSIATIIAGLLGILAAAYLYAMREVDSGASQD